MKRPQRLSDQERRAEKLRQIAADPHVRRGAWEAAQAELAKMQFEAQVQAATAHPVLNTLRRGGA